MDETIRVRDQREREIERDKLDIIFLVVMPE
jgi:hypothetical protein